MITRIIFFVMLFMSSCALNAQTIMNIHQSNGTVTQIPLNTIDSITYTIPNPSNLATISSLSISNITSTSATSGGDISNDGGTPVTQRGIVWSISPIPTTANNSTNYGNGTGIYSSDLTGLIANTTYYVRAYATNSAGTAYGNELSFTTSAGIVSNPGVGVSFDGYTYLSVLLGNGQEWMAENLRTTTYANGDPISNVTDLGDWESLSTGAWCHYNNDSLYDNPSGKLYNWFTVADSRNVCPTGWHVPSDAEYMLLIDYSGGVLVAGGNMKSTGTQYWQSPNTDATNESGFSGLPGGIYAGSGHHSFGTNGGYWSSTEDGSLYAGPNYALSLTLMYANGEGYISPIPKGTGISVRCLRD
jgi:uncharacterized protein (TIGR02145 family)